MNTDKCNGILSYRCLSPHYRWLKNRDFDKASRSFFAVAFLLVVSACAQGQEIFIRVNQIGYLPNEPKVVMAFSQTALPSEFVLEKGLHDIVFDARATPVDNVPWGEFSHHEELDFSSVHSPGKYVLKIGNDGCPIQIGQSRYGELTQEVLEFMREQRCGYNPWFGTKCHQLDGRTAFGPEPAGTAIDVTGGWHDAGDTLKYLMTSEDATAQMLLAYLLAPKSENVDHFRALGLRGGNGIPDVLDEARWGLEWMLKMHPAADQLYHQVGDDRDHNGWRLPQNDPADYGWGKGGARVVYFADGKPQGLRQYKSESTGAANIAGVYSAAMGLAYEIWKSNPEQKTFAAKCLRAGREVYEIGRAEEGVQQGDSYGAPYRYAPTIWAGDMEWGAAELFRATHEQHYLDDAKRYAKMAADESWMGKKQTGHYQYFPFMNVGHFRLYDLVDSGFKKTLADYYRAGIERCEQAGEKNPYRIGVPFIWCSNNLMVALVTQCLLYERMTGDTQYREFANKQRDWLLGRNPWGTSMFTGIGLEYPKDVHLATVQLLHRPVRGGLVDGPVYQRIFESLKGVGIRKPDPLAAFQGAAVYHDDGRDYSTNEPTLDGTASGILMFALCDSANN